MELIEVIVKQIIQDTESDGCYRLVLEDLEGGLDIPIVISEWDARPLITTLNSEKSFRPQTHDLFHTFIEASGHQLSQIIIHTFRRGVFYVSLNFTHSEKEGFELDARPTDAIALAMRTKAPIFINNEIVQKIGSLMNNDMSQMKLPQRLLAMEEKLKRLIDEERYEEAAILRDRIHGLKTKNS